MRQATGGSHVLLPWCVSWQNKVGELNTPCRSSWLTLGVGTSWGMLYGMHYPSKLKKKTCFVIANLHMSRNPDTIVWYYPPEYRIKGKCHGKSALAWSLVVWWYFSWCCECETIFQLAMICTRPTLWSESELSKCEMFIIEKKSNHHTIVLPDQILQLRVTWLSRAKLHLSAQNAAIWSIASCR